MKEQWKKIKDYPYEVSSFGKVRSLDKYQDFPLFSEGNVKGNKISMTKVFRKGKIMKQTKTASGYFLIYLKIRKLNGHLYTGLLLRPLYKKILKDCM